MIASELPRPCRRETRSAEPIRQIEKTLPRALLAPVLQLQFRGKGDHAQSVQARSTTWNQVASLALRAS